MAVAVVDPPGDSVVGLQEDFVMDDSVVGRREDFAVEASAAVEEEEVVVGLER